MRKNTNKFPVLPALRGPVPGSLSVFMAKTKEITVHLANFVFEKPRKIVVFGEKPLKILGKNNFL